MDIIIIELPNGHIHSSSFHVRFSSKQVLTSDNVDILIYINGKKKDIKMKLSKSGDAYFSLEKIDKYILDQSNIKIKDNENDYYYIDMNINDINNNKNKLSSLFPSEDQIKKMDLNIGINEVCFAIETYLGGIQVLKSNIYFYKCDLSNKNIKFIINHNHNALYYLIIIFNILFKIIYFYSYYIILNIKKNFYNISN